MSAYKIVSFYVITVTLIGIILAESFEDAQSGTKCVKERTVKHKANGKTSKSKAQFLLFTPKNKEEAEFLHKSCSKLSDDSYFDEKLPIKIIIHGFLDGVCRHAWMREMKEEFFKRGDFNIILVDWSHLVLYDPNIAQVGLKKVAKDIGKLINNIKKKKHVSAESFHLIGHSLGGQMTSFITKYSRVERITGLDPAGIGYHNLPDTERLDRSDAVNIDVFHTSPGLCLPSCGFVYPIASADFYFGYGSFQPSCYTSAFEAIIKGNLEIAFASLLVPQVCAHLFATDLFKATINPGECQYIGKPCENYESALNKQCKVDCKENKDCAVMGLDWMPNNENELNKSLIYHVDLQLPCPYCSPETHAAGEPRLPM